MIKKLYNNLSLYRIIATICVLQFHIFFILYTEDITYTMFLSKGVQGLTVLSGFLYSQKLIKDVKRFYLNNLIKILVPAIVCLLFMAIWNLLAMFITHNYDYIGLFFGHRVFDNGLLFQPANFYYLAYILVCYLITPILQRNDKYAVFTVIFVILVELTLGFFFRMSIIATAYIVGYYIGKKAFNKYVECEEKYNVFRLLLWTALTAVTIICYIIYVKHPFTGHYYFRYYFSLLVRNIILTAFGIASFFLIIYLFRWLNRFKESKVLTECSKYTLHIYLMNQAFMIGGMNVASWVDPLWAKYILVYVFVIVISIGLKYLSDCLIKRFTPKAIKQY